MDPFHVHAYWELDEGERLRALERLDAGVNRIWVLRFFDVTAPAGAPERVTSFDVPVDPDARNWYVELWSAGRTYRVELGLVGGDRFQSLCRSATVALPRARPHSAPPPPAPGPTPVAPRSPAPTPAVQSSTGVAVEPSRAPPAAPALPPPVLGDEYAAWLRGERERERTTPQAEQTAAEPRFLSAREHARRVERRAAEPRASGDVTRDIAVQCDAAPAAAPDGTFAGDEVIGSKHAPGGSFFEGLGSMRAPGGSFFEGLASMRAPDRSG